MKIFRRSRKFKFISLWLLIFTIYVFYMEIHSYSSNKNNWLAPKCRNQVDCTRILLVADPQIIGLYKEILHVITPFSIWDSDAYLKKTYHHAFNFAQPDIVIFLGDLMDEGSIASNADFYGYVRRIFSIFLNVGGPNVKHIWLPGDNDVGGENFDMVTNEKLHRFYRAFAQPELVVHRNITFFKINRLINSMPIFTAIRDFYDTSKLFVGLSHVPLMFSPSPFAENVFKKMLPQIVFTAHEHKAMIISTDGFLRQDRHIIPVTNEIVKIYEFTLGMTDMYEFIIPTCSYRMGTDKVGFGFALIEKNEVRFTILWSPSRFNQLKNYLKLVICFAISFLVYILCCKCLKRG